MILYGIQKKFVKADPKNLRNGSLNVSEMFRKDESNQRYQGLGDYKNVPQAPGLWEVKPRPPPKAAGPQNTP